MLSLLSNIPLFRRHTNKAKRSIQNRIDPLSLFTCQTTDNCDKSNLLIVHHGCHFPFCTAHSNQSDLSVKTEIHTWGIWTTIKLFFIQLTKIHVIQKTSFVHSNFHSREACDTLVLLLHSYGPVMPHEKIDRELVKPFQLGMECITRNGIRSWHWKVGRRPTCERITETLYPPPPDLGSLRGESEFEPQAQNKILVSFRHP